MSADTDRLDFLERVSATVYRSQHTNPAHWVVVPEDEETRVGIIGTSLRQAIDRAMGGK